jgi:replication fork clamp-binding protein CrfC
MMQSFPQCANLQSQVEQVLALLGQEPKLRSQQDTTAVQGSLRKALAPTFDIVFAGAFSAGKSMLINALLERELLYSAEGHATGTECKIAYAQPGQERVVLTFLSEAEIGEQANALCRRLGIEMDVDIRQRQVVDLLRQTCQELIQREGGESKSERAKQVSALQQLIDGYETNQQHIHPSQNSTYSMQEFNFSNLQEAAGYARRGSNSAVLKRVEYYCNHPLLEDGNVIIDTPGIDAPVKRDAELTYHKIEDPDTSAVVCVLKPASAGDMSSEETKLMETIRQNPGVRDRVFYAFNRVDETWYNADLRARLNRLINAQFQDSPRVYRTSGLLGFYGSQIKHASPADRFGLDSLFAESVKVSAQAAGDLPGGEATPQFVSEFIRYCMVSDKLDPVRLPLPPEVLQDPTVNAKYVRILNSLGQPVIDQLIQDSGITQFREAITRYLTEEKRPLLFANLADDLQPLCIALKQRYVEQWQQLESQPREADAIKEQELHQLSKDLKQVGDRFRQHIEKTVNEAVASRENTALEADYLKLKARMVHRLGELLDTFSVGEVHQRAQASHKRNSVVPLLGILAEGFYYLANELEDVLVSAAEELVSNFFQRLLNEVRQQDYYRDLYRLLGQDGGIEQTLTQLRGEVIHAMRSEAVAECDRYVRERPEFYTEGNVVLYQFRQTLQQACRSYDYQGMVEAEPAIRQLLQLDFEQKVKSTVQRTFRQTINQTLNHHLLAVADTQADAVLQQYAQAREYLEKTLDKEANETLRRNQDKRQALKAKMDDYNDAIAGINNCLESLHLDRQKLPAILSADLTLPPVMDGNLEETPEVALAEAETAAEFTPEDAAVGAEA